MDNLKRTQDWLEHYHDWKAFIQSANRLIKDYRSLLALEAAPGTVKYGQGLTGGGPFDSQEERTAERHEQMTKEVELLQAKVQTALDRTAAIDKAISRLVGPDRDIAKYRGIEGKPWDLVSYYSNYSSDGCRAKYKKILGKLAIVIFGEGL